MTIAVHRKRRFPRQSVLRGALWLAALTLLTGCGAESPQLEPLAPDTPLLAFGDSLTYGTGAGEGEDYPSRLARLSGHPVINAGVPGELTASGRERLPRLLDRYRPGLLILLHGGNDLLRRQPPTVVEANLRAMVETARARGIPVVLLGVPRPNLSTSVPAFYDRLAADYGLPYDGELLRDLERDPALKADPVHLNGKGYRRLAEGVLDMLVRSGALPAGG